jgi:hypothetical protein
MKFDKTPYVHASQTSTKVNKKSSALPIWESKVTIEGRTGTNRRTPSTAHFMQELGALDRAVATKTKSVHHPQTRCCAKVAAQGAMAKRERQHKSTGRWAHPHLQKNIALITITAIVSSSFIPAFSGNVTHHQNDCTLLPDHVQEDLRHQLTCRSRRCDRCP